MEALRKQLNPTQRMNNPVAKAIRLKKTIKIGNKTDPYQRAESGLKITRKAIKLIAQAGISFIIQTRNTTLLLRDIDLFKDYKELVTIMPIVTPGLEKDWDIFERKINTNPLRRLEHIQKLKDMGFNVGVNGEPYIPGYHTLEDMENTIRIISQIGTSYNTYNFHENDFVYKRMAELQNPEVDIVKIWTENKDEPWGKLLPEIIKIAARYNVVLGCPDFVNSGKYLEKSNTCCGINVPNPFTFNAVNFKRDFLNGLSEEETIDKNYEGIGDIEEGKVLFKKDQKIFTLHDIKYGGK